MMIKVMNYHYNYIILCTHTNISDYFVFMYVFSKWPHYLVLVFFPILQLKSPTILISLEVGLGGLGVTCSPRDPQFAGSNPTEVDGWAG